MPGTNISAIAAKIEARFPNDMSRFSRLPIARRR